MKEERLFEAFTDIDDEFIVAAAPSGSVKNRLTKIRRRWLYAAASVAIVAIAGVAVWQSANPDKMLTEGPSADTHKYEVSQNAEGGNGGTDGYTLKNGNTEQKSSASGGECILEPRWDEKSISEKFGEVNLGDDRRYNSTVTEIPSGNIGEKIENVELTGFDIYEDKYYTATAQAYSIKGISSSCALALRFDGGEEYYAYINTLYQPATLEDITAGLNFKDNAQFGFVSFNSWKIYAGVSYDAVYEMLLSDGSIEKAYDSYNSYELYDGHERALSMGVSIPLLGIENKAIDLTRDGYLRTNILGVGTAYYIGEDRVNDFISYVTENCDPVIVCVFPYNDDVVEIPE